MCPDGESSKCCRTPVLFLFNWPATPACLTFQIEMKLAIDLFTYIHNAWLNYFLSEECALKTLDISLSISFGEIVL